MEPPFFFHDSLELQFYAKLFVSSHLLVDIEVVSNFAKPLLKEYFIKSAYACIFILFCSYACIFAR